jgi:Leucine-rich repeat (LRR) protein
MATFLHHCALDRNLFKDLVELRLLELSENRLTGIQQDTFRSLAKLETLNLKGNQILAA